MTTPHVVTAPTAPPVTLPARSGWKALSEAMTKETPEIAGRSDLTVVIAPGVTGDALALFAHGIATIAIDGANLGIDPDTARPWRPADRYRYAPTWGALTHECAHAAHSRWTAAPGTDPEIAAAADLLEESRIEAAQVRRRPADRHWLRASTRELVLADTPGGELAATQIAPTRYAAAQSAALILARIDAGVLEADECARVAAAIEEVLGRDLLRQLRTLWRIAQRLSDTNTTGMLELARRWFDLVGPEPHTTPQPGSPLGQAIVGDLGEVATRVASDTPPPDPAQEAEDAARAEAEHTRLAETAAKKVFGKRAVGRHTRTPREGERSAARVLARALNTASQRERATVKTTSALPPGRLRMRGVMAREAQRAAGAMPTAEPFTRTTRKPVPTPPLRVGIACDVSGSMIDYTADVASAAWIIAAAAELASMPAQTATVAFGRETLPITYAGTAPKRVTEFTAKDNYEAIDVAVAALDGALGLSRPEHTRLLVIISDGYFRTEPRATAQKRLDRLRASGCAVLWLSPDELATPMKGVTEHVLADPTVTAATIARAAVTAVRTA